MAGTATATLTGALTYGPSATLRYNTTHTAGAEWPATSPAGKLAGGIIIAATSTVTANGAKVISAGTVLTVSPGATLAMSTFLLTLNDDFITTGATSTGSGGVTIAGTDAVQSIGGYTNTGTSTITKTAGTATFTGNVSGAGLTINGVGGTLNLGAGLTHTFSGNTALSAGTFNQGSSNLTITGTLTVSVGGIFTHIGTGSLTLGGAVANAGTITIDGTLAGCGDTDILITATAPRAWSGAGTFNLTDVNMVNQTTALTIVVWSGTQGAGTTGFTINAGCNIPTLTVGATAGSMDALEVSGAISTYANSTSCTASSTCAAFTLSLNTGTSTLNSLKITETGTASSANLSDLALFYTTSSVGSSASTTFQFGSTVPSFTADAATVSGSLSMSSGTPYYFFVRYDLAGTSTYPASGETIDFQIAANTDVTFLSPATSTGTFPVNLPGSTLVTPNATSVTYGSGLSDGARSGESVTIGGYGFGTPSAGANRADCSTATTNRGCVRFVAGGNATVDASSITNWTNTAITFTVSSTLATDGATSSLQVTGAAQNDATPLTYYVYPNVTGLTALAANAARTYDAADTDGLAYLTGDHLGSAGTATILATAATQHATAGSYCATGSYTSSTACLEVPSTIVSSTYTGNVILTRTSDSKTSTWSDFRILPRISTTTPASGTAASTTVQLIGNHFCESGTCLTATSSMATATDNVLFWNTTSTSADFQTLTGGAGVCNGTGNPWTNTEVCVTVPSATPTGSATTTLTSNGYTSNGRPFNASSTGPTLPGAPGTPTYGAPTTSTVSVNWTAATGADYYKLERGTNGNGPFGFDASTTLLTLTDIGLSPNTIYWYHVLGHNTAGDGPVSATSSVRMLPGQPTAPTYTNVASTTLTVNWMLSFGADSYKLERGMDGNGPFSQIATPTATAYPDTGLATSTAYWYRVRGHNTSGDGPYSTTSSVTTANGLPSFVTSSSLISVIYDTVVTGGVAPNSVTWEGIQPAGTVVKFQFAASNETSGQWSYVGWNPDTKACDSSSYYTGTPNTPIEIKAACHQNKRYIRYKVLLQTSDVTVTPRVDRILLNYAS